VYKFCSTQETDQNSLEILQEENTNLLMDSQRLKSRNSELTQLYEESERMRYDLGEEFESMKKTIDHIRVDMHKDQEANKLLREVRKKFVIIDTPKDGGNTETSYGRSQATRR
jgi:predicted RNase H-like nuclease (RuvC/YqgF family)